MTAPTEQVSPVEQESPEDPEVQHLWCEDGPRNMPKPTVMCCGLPDHLAGEEIPEGILMHPQCPLCALAFESGACACFYWS